MKITDLEYPRKKNDDPINPSHYNRLDPQPKDVIRAWGLNFNLGSAVKYISRAGYKDDIVQDLKKAQEFIQFEIDAIEAERNEEKAPEEKEITVSAPVDATPEEIIEIFIHSIYGL